MRDDRRDDQLIYVDLQCANTRILLFGIRRMAACGLRDAHAANVFISAFGMAFRRPLLLLRALMAEVARASARQITVAPCCCGRVTGAEAEILAVVASARESARGAHVRLSWLLGVDECVGALTSAQAVAQAFADLGRPIRYPVSAGAVPASPID